MASIRTRLTVTYTAALLGTMVAFAGTLLFARKQAAYRELQRYVLDEAGVATRLLARAAGPKLPLTETKDELIGPQVVERVRFILDALPNIVILADTNGRLVYRSIDARLLESASLAEVLGNARAIPPGQPTAAVPVARDTTLPEIRRYWEARGLPRTDRVLVMRVDADPELLPIRTIIVGASTVGADRATREPFGALLAIVPLVLLLSIGAAYYIAGSTLRPLEHVRTEVEAITDGRSLHRRLPVEESGDELARLAATLNEMIGRLETSFGGLRRFTADASHELKTPLTVLRADVERAMNVAPGSPDQLVALEEALQETTRMANLVDSLLTLARFDEGRFDLHREPVDLEALTRDVFETALILGEAAHLTIALPVCEPARVLGDHARLRQLFLNLVTNAIKYTPPGGSVELSLRCTSDTVAFAVRDTGIGIAAADLPYIFDRFWRADRARSRRIHDGSAIERGGFGLGLAISQWIAQAHGGTLAVASRLTRGSTFTVTLPLLETAAPPIGSTARSGE